VTDIPWDKLGIPDAMRGAVAPDAPRPLRLAAAKGALPATQDALLGALYVLSCGDDAEVRDTALATIRGLPGVVNALSQRTHPKVLELLANTREERDLDERIILIRNTNDRTATLIAGRAGDKLCELICENHERLLLTPDVLVALHQNRSCPDAPLERAIAFMRMQGALPPLPASRPRPGDPRPKVPATAAKPAPAPAAAVFDLEAEIEAALAGRPSPHLEQQSRLQMFDLDKVQPGGLEGFSFDFKEDDNFSLDLIDEGEDRVSDDPDAKAGIEKRIAAMSVGQKLKLAYLGNKSTRSILIRDRNKMVAVAVVKSGRLTDAEVLAHAGNRNLPDEALREIAINKEWTRKYPVKVALANNPKCPPSVAVSLVNQLQAKDLASLARNRNVSSVVFQLAGKLLKQKAV
jgi:hypothetical protein